MAKTQTAASKKAAQTPAQKGQTKARQVPAGTMSSEPKLATVPEVPVVDEQRQGERRQAEANAVAKFTASTLQTPAAHTPELSEEQKKFAAFQAEVAKLAATFGVSVPAAVAKAPRASNRIVQNGETRPAQGTVTGQIWDVADQISASQAGAPAQVSQLKAHPALKQVNDHTLKTQYARWRKFHNITGRLQVVQMPASMVVGQYDAALPVNTPKQ